MDSQSTVPVKEYSSFKGKLMDYIAFRILEFSLLQSIYPIYEVYEVSTTLSWDIKWAGTSKIWTHFAPIAKDNGHTFLNPLGIFEEMKYFA